jgi:predicted RNase H-like HicB family nuclease
VTVFWPAARPVEVAAPSEIIFNVQEEPEGGFVAEALGHAIVTQGDTMEELRRMVRDAVRCHFEPNEMPAVIRLHMVKDEVLAV